MIPVLQHWGIRKQKRFTNKTYLGFIAERNCLICGSPTVEVSHTICKSAGTMGSDALTLPLCYQHHRGTNGIHSLSVNGFQDWYSIDLNEAVYAMWTMFFHKQGMSLDHLISGLTTREEIIETVEFNIRKVTRK